MIITVTLNPAVDKTVVINDFEAGTVNRISSSRLDAGGKGINVSKVIASLGGRSLAAGILGGSAGGFIKDYLDRSGIENDFLSIEGETRTNLKIIDPHRKINTDINEAGPQIKDEDVGRLKQIIFSRTGAGTIVVLSGSVPANIDKGIYGRWISDARRVGAKAILDADGEALKYGLEAGPFLIKPNIHELGRYFEKEIKDAGEAERLVRSLIDRFDIEMAAVSLGEKGALFLNRECSLLAHGIPVEVKSTVGAGDSMVAALAYSIEMGLDFEGSARLAVAAATANVMTSGTQPADRDTILSLEKRVSFEYLNAKKD